MYWKVHWSAMYWLWTDVLICNTFTLWNWPDNNQLHWQLFSNTLSLTYFDLVSSNVIFKLWYWIAAGLAVGQFFLSLLASPPLYQLIQTAKKCSKQAQNSQIRYISITSQLHLVSGNFWDWLKSFNTDTFTWCEFQSLILTLLNWLWEKLVKWLLINWAKHPQVGRRRCKKLGVIIQTRGQSFHNYILISPSL